MTSTFLPIMRPRQPCASSLLPYLKRIAALGCKTFVDATAVGLGRDPLLLRQLSYGLALTRNQFPFKYIMYYIPAVFLYAAALWSSHESYAKGKVSWKGREYPVGSPGASK